MERVRIWEAPKGTLTLLHVDAVTEFEKEFDDDQFRRMKRTFLVSVSEHGDSEVNEDAFGRLSMWRAYGGKTNVALVLKSQPFISESDALSAHTSPVLYADVPDFERHFSSFVNQLLLNQGLLSEVGWPTVSKYLHWAMRNAVLSTKHPGFLEEREWRVIYTPDYDLKKRMIPQIVTVEGVPQRIYKIPLQDYPDEGFIGATISDLLDRIIVGPTEYPWELRQAFVEKLEELRVAKPEDKVVISGIPLRRS